MTKQTMMKWTPPAGSLTPWMDAAYAYHAKGVHELRGDENDLIIEMFEIIGKPEFSEDEIPWCAGFIGACLWLAGQGHDGSAWAADYGKWTGADLVWKKADGAKKRKAVQYGDIMVMTRQGGGHVTFFLEDNGDGTFRCLGGNQTDAVTETSYPWSRVTRVMRPNGSGLPKREMPTEDEVKTPEPAAPIAKRSLTKDVLIPTGSGAVGAAPAVADGSEWWLVAVLFVVVAAVAGFVYWKWFRKG